MSRLIHPYDVGLLLGSEADFVLANINSEPLDAATILKESKTYEVDRCRGDNESSINYNHYKVKRHMVRLYTASDHCRGYAIDNIWLTMKALIIELSKRAHISFHQSFIDEKEKEHTAGGRLRMSCADAGIYADESHGWLMECLDIDSGNKYSTPTRRNLLLMPVLVNLLMDRRCAAEKRRKVHGPDSTTCFRRDGEYLILQALSNLWLYHPSLTHLTLGAARLAVLVAINGLTDAVATEKEIPNKKIAEVITNSDYDQAQHIWDTIKFRLFDIYDGNDNPFAPELVKTIDFIIEYGIGVLGPGVYANWRLNRKQDNYCGHLSDLVGWEDHVFHRIFNKKHPMHEMFTKYIT